MHRHSPCLPALARADTDRWKLRIERDVRNLKPQGLGYPQTGSPLLCHQKARPWVVGCSDDGLDLVGFEVLRKGLGLKFLALVSFLGVLAAGPATASDSSSCHVGTFNTQYRLDGIFGRSAKVIVGN